MQRNHLILNICVKLEHTSSLTFLKKKIVFYYVFVLLYCIILHTFQVCIIYGSYFVPTKKKTQNIKQTNDFSSYRILGLLNVEFFILFINYYTKLINDKRATTFYPK